MRLFHGIFPGKVKQNPTTQTHKLSAIDCLIIVYNKITVKARGFNQLPATNKLQEVLAIL
jgi:hypothetical protein